MIFTNTFQLSNHSSLLEFDVHQYFQIPKSYSSLLRTMFTIVTSFNSPDRIALPPKCLQFEVPTNTLYTHYIEVSIYSNSYFKLHSPVVSQHHLFHSSSHLKNMLLIQLPALFSGSGWTDMAENFQGRLNLSISMLPVFIITQPRKNSNQRMHPPRLPTR